MAFDWNWFVRVYWLSNTPVPGVEPNAVSVYDAVTGPVIFQLEPGWRNPLRSFKGKSVKRKFSDWPAEISDKGNKTIRRINCFRVIIGDSI